MFRIELITILLIYNNILRRYIYKKYLAEVKKIISNDKLKTHDNNCLNMLSSNINFLETNIRTEEFLKKIEQERFPNNTLKISCALSDDS